MLLNTTLASHIMKAWKFKRNSLINFNEESVFTKDFVMAKFVIKNNFNFTYETSSI